MNNLLWGMPVFSPSLQSLNAVPQENSTGSTFSSDSSESFSARGKKSSLCGFNVSIEQITLGVLAHGKEKKASVKAFGSPD